MAAAAGKVAREHVTRHSIIEPRCLVTSGIADADALEVKVRVK